MPWQSITLGGLFPNQAAEFARINEETELLQGKFNRAVSNIQARIDQTNVTLDRTQNFLSALEASGIYVLFLAPGEGDLRDRVASETDGYPAGLNLSAGIVVGALAANVFDLQRAWADLLRIFSNNPTAPPPI